MVVPGRLSCAVYERINLDGHQAEEYADSHSPSALSRLRIKKAGSWFSVKVHDFFNDVPPSLLLVPRTFPLFPFPSTVHATNILPFFADYHIMGPSQGLPYTGSKPLLPYALSF